MTAGAFKKTAPGFAPGADRFWQTRIKDGAD